MIAYRAPLDVTGQFVALVVRGDLLPEDAGRSRPRWRTSVSGSESGPASGSGSDPAHGAYPPSFGSSPPARCYWRWRWKASSHGHAPHPGCAQGRASRRTCASCRRARCTCLQHWGRAYVAHASALSGVVLNLNELVPVSFDPGQAVGLLTAAGMPTAVLSWSVTPKIRTSSWRLTSH